MVLELGLFDLLWTRMLWCGWFVYIAGFLLAVYLLMCVLVICVLLNFGFIGVWLNVVAILCYFGLLRSWVLDYCCCLFGFMLTYVGCCLLVSWVSCICLFNSVVGLVLRWFWFMFYKCGWLFVCGFVVFLFGCFDFVIVCGKVVCLIVCMVDVWLLCLLVDYVLFVVCLLLLRLVISLDGCWGGKFVWFDD